MVERPLVVRRRMAAAPFRTARLSALSFGKRGLRSGEMDLIAAFLCRNARYRTTFWPNSR